MEIALHESIHAVVLRLDGVDIADVVDQGDAAWTRLVEPHKFSVAALMANRFALARSTLAPVMTAIFRSSLPSRLHWITNAGFRGQVDDPATSRRIFPPRCTCVTASLMAERG
jgi:hypothetical protein